MRVLIQRPSLKGGFETLGEAEMEPFEVAVIAMIYRVLLKVSMGWFRLEWTNPHERRIHG